MAGTIINGSHLTGIVLNTPATENPATIAATGYITNTTTAYDGDAVFGLAGTAWRITNLGTANATGTGSAGVFLSSGGSVTNGSSSSTAALIEGAGSGVVVSGAAGTVTNFGTIEATGTTSDGVVLGAGGSVTNGASGAPGGLIDGSFLGVVISGSPGTVVNFGTIAAEISGLGVFLEASGNVTNGASTATAALISAPGGTAVNLGTGTLTNFGTIQSGGENSFGVTGARVALTNFGTILSTGDNGFGVFVGNGGSLYNTGLISAYHVGAAGFTADGPGTVVNLGTIQSTQTATPTGAIGDGVLLQSGGTVTNGSTTHRNAVISAVDGSAFSIGGTAGGVGTVTNFGTIETTGVSLVPLGPAIYLGGGGTITNYGLIKGAVPSTGGTQGVITTHHDLATIRNFGTIASTNGNDAIHIDHGGTVINGATDATGALISGLSSGIVGGNNPSTHVAYGAGASGTVLNYGTIQSTGTGSVISFSSGGAVTNHGLIEGGGVYLSGGGVITNGASDATTAVIISSTSIAVNIKGATGRITNFGTIQNSGTHSAIYLGATGSVMNGSSGSTAALLKGGADGVHVGGSTATVTNFGTIDGVSGDGIALDAGGTITNRGLIEGGADGVYFGATASAAHIVNDGTVKGKIGFSVAAGNTANNALTNAGRIIGSGGTAVQFGAGNDVLTVDAGAVFKGAVSGGSGTNKLVEGAPGTLTVAGFSGFETIVLADGGSDMLTLKSANFDGVTKGTITIDDGNMGNTVSAIGEAAADRIVVHAGSGADLLTGGPGNDVFYAGGDITMIGGLGSNEFIFTAPGGNTIEDFAKSSTNRLVFSNSGFDLGLGGGATPKRFTAAEAAALFTANPTGTFADTSQRLAYDTTSHELFSSSDGSGSTPQLVATLSDHAAISASQLFYISGAGGSG